MDSFGMLTSGTVPEPLITLPSKPLKPAANNSGYVSTAMLRDLDKSTAPSAVNPEGIKTPGAPVDMSSSGSAKKNWKYVNADLAKQYKMSKSVAYQEALANTSMQRYMQDLKQAGLNPNLAAGGGGGAGGVSVGGTAARGGGGGARRTLSQQDQQTSAGGFMSTICRMFGMKSDQAAAFQEFAEQAGMRVDKGLQDLRNVVEFANDFTDHVEGGIEKLVSFFK